MAKSHHGHPGHPGHPVAGQPLQPFFGDTPQTPDPDGFTVAHPSDNPLYNLVNKKLLQPIPSPRDPNNMVLTLQQVLGAGGDAAVQKIEDSGQLVFHSGGDTGITRFTIQTEYAVVEKMCNDYDEVHSREVPSFFFHLGDVVYSFGEGRYYYDQFYEPYRNYPAPILAIPGNHDGLVYSGDNETSLEAFLRNFVASTVGHSDDASGIMRTTMAQPGVYFAFDAPFVTIIGLYSNVLEDPGVISSQGEADSPVDDQQLSFLKAQLLRVKDSGRAVIVAVHHPAYTVGKIHGASPKMLEDLDNACKAADFWPHVFLAGHAHNYQRFTRTVGNFDVPYIVCGNAGHNVTSLTKKNATPLRAHTKMAPGLVFESYDDSNYGYLRIVCNKDMIRVEYHDADLNQKSDSDAVTVDLKTHTMVSN